MSEGCVDRQLMGGPTVEHGVSVIVSGIVCVPLSEVYGFQVYSSWSKEHVIVFLRAHPALPSPEIQIQSASPLPNGGGGGGGGRGVGVVKDLGAQ